MFNMLYFLWIVEEQLEIEEFKGAIESVSFER